MQKPSMALILSYESAAIDTTVKEASLSIAAGFYVSSGCQIQALMLVQRAFNQLSHLLRLLYMVCLPNKFIEHYDIFSGSSRQITIFTESPFLASGLYLENKSCWCPQRDNFQDLPVSTLQCWGYGHLQPRLDIYMAAGNLSWSFHAGSANITCPLSHFSMTPTCASVPVSSAVQIYATGPLRMNLLLYCVL